MTPKRYEQSDPIIQWAYFMEDVKPLHSSTCALFWRSVVLTPIKVCGPVFIVGFLLFMAVVTVLGWVAPSWVPEGLRTPPRQWSGDDTFVLLTIVGVGAVGVIGYLTGLWGWLHSFCQPIEIAGGLVQKGSCPSCAGTIIVVNDQHWECRRCKGYFVPPPAADAVDPAKGSDHELSTRDTGSSS